MIDLSICCHGLWKSKGIMALTNVVSNIYHKISRYEIVDYTHPYFIEHNLMATILNSVMKKDK